MTNLGIPYAEYVGAEVADVAWRRRGHAVFTRIKAYDRALAELRERLGDGDLVAARRAFDRRLASLGASGDIVRPGPRVVRSRRHRS